MRMHLKKKEKEGPIHRHSIDQSEKEIKIFTNPLFLELNK